MSKIPIVPELEQELAMPVVEDFSQSIAYPLASATWGDIAQVVLTEGEWDVIGHWNLTTTGVGLNTVAIAIGSFPDTDFTDIDGGIHSVSKECVASTNGQQDYMMAPMRNFIVPKGQTLTVYLKSRLESNANTITNFSCRIRARRVNKAVS